MTRQKPINILLVEDDEGQAILFQDNLQNSGVITKIFTAPDGESALDFLHKRGAYENDAEITRPDLILLDLNLPTLSGFDVLRQVKEDPKLKIIPVIILTSTANQHEVNKSYQLGANTYITKPVNYDQLKERVKNLGLFLEMISLPEED